MMGKRMGRVGDDGLETAGLLFGGGVVKQAVRLEIDAW